MRKRTSTGTFPMVIQFIHPGREYQVTNETNGPINIPWVGGSCDTSCGGHTRRLVSHKGDYVDSTGKVKTGQLAFWTEWEACTTAVAMAAAPKDRFSAHWVHTIKTPLVKKPGTLNTDPCVFGSTFKYCCCQQTKNGTMRKLAPGSLILFGSHMDGRFFLDTLFVIDGAGLPYEGGKPDEISVSREYRQLALNRMNGGELTFYRGKACCSAGKGQPYSFAPAQLFDAKDGCCGKRFSLDLGKLNQCLPLDSQRFSPGLNQGFKAIEAESIVVSAVWMEIHRQVLNAKFVLGVHFDWPQ